MGTGFSKRKKEAKMLQEQLAKMKTEIESAEATGTSEQGLVTVTLSGNHEMKSVKIKKECVDPDDVEGLELLVKTAYNDANKKLEEQSSKNMGGLGGLGGALGGGFPNIPGFPSF